MTNIRQLGLGKGTGQQAGTGFSRITHRCNHGVI